MKEESSFQMSKFQYPDLHASPYKVEYASPYEVQSSPTLPLTI